MEALNKKYFVAANILSIAGGLFILFYKKESLIVTAISLIQMILVTMLNCFRFFKISLTTLLCCCKKNSQAQKKYKEKGYIFLNVLEDGIKTMDALSSSNAGEEERQLLNNIKSNYKCIQIKLES
jgi:predicted membrane protein